jgi:NAD(P)-dependent dehydrogenase (short-subunit alcohol dehydrogenase family)
MKRSGKADDIASLTSFLPSLDADWIPGQVINVDGCRCSLHTRG